MAIQYFFAGKIYAYKLSAWANTAIIIFTFYYAFLFICFISYLSCYFKVNMGMKSNKADVGKEENEKHTLQ